MEKYTELLTRLVSINTLSGFESCAAAELCRTLSSYDFDSVTCDSLGNVILRKAPGKAAPVLVLDAHIDQIGFRVEKILDGGFVSVVAVGGTDPVILPATKVTLHGREKLRGVFTVQSAEGQQDEKKMYVDTGYPPDRLRDVLAVGDAVTFDAPICKMNGEMLVGHSFDDKALVAALVCTAADTKREDLAFELVLTLSSREEVGGGGAACAATRISPVGAIVTDVNFARAPGVSVAESGGRGDGVMLSLSAVTDRRLTSQIRSIASECGVPVTCVVEASNTGTNASSVYTCGAGVPTAVVSLPLASMHTASECMNLADAKNLCVLLREIIASHALARDLKEREDASYV